MSECKHEWNKSNGRICGKCGESYIAYVEKQNTECFELMKSQTDIITDLRAKLKEKQRMLDLANKALERGGSAARFGIKRNVPEDALVFRDTEETLAQNWDDEPAYSQKQWRELEQDRDNIQAQLQAAEERLARVDEAIPGMLALADEVQKVEIENRNLQAAHEVLRGALEVVNVAVEELFTACPEEAFDTLKTNTRHAIDLALSTTPEQAGERVQYLVTVAEDTLNWLRQNKLGGTGHGRCLADALAKYRGGADGEHPADQQRT